MSKVKKKIIKEAGDLFYVYGFKRVSMDEIASRSGVSKKTLYSLYSSKNELMKIFVEGKVEGFVSAAEKLIDNLFESDNSFQDYMELFGELSGFISSPMITDMNGMPHLFEIIDTKRQRIFIKLRDVLNRAKEEDKINPDLNISVFMEMLTSVVTSVVTPKKLVELNISPGDLIEQVITVLFLGIYKYDQDEIRKPALMFPWFFSDTSEKGDK